MRGSIASLVIVAFVFGSVLIEKTGARAKMAWIGWGLVAASAPSAAVEVGRAVATPGYAISDCGLIEATRAAGIEGLPTNYIVAVAAVPAWLIDVSQATLSPTQSRACWPDRVPPRYPGL